jgi:hypothetical protein
LPVTLEAVRFRAGGCVLNIVKNPVTDDIQTLAWVNPRGVWGKLTLSNPSKPDIVQAITGTVGEVSIPAGYPWGDTPTSLNVGIVY